MFSKLGFQCLLKVLNNLYLMPIIMGVFLLFCLLVCAKPTHAEEPKSNDETQKSDPPAEKEKREGPRFVIHATGNRARASFAPRPPAPPPARPPMPPPPGQPPPTGPQPGPPSLGAPPDQPSDGGPTPKPPGEPSEKPSKEPHLTPPAETDEQKDVSRHAEPIFGISAGDETSRHGFWTTAMVADLESFETDEKYDGALYMMLVGADHKITESFLGGVSLGYEYVNLDADTNEDAFESRGFTITPYVAIVLFENLTFDAVFSYAVLNNEVKQVSDDADAVFGNYTSQRTVISANFNYYMLKANWHLSTVAGYMYVNEDQDAYRLTDENTDSVEEATSYVGEWRFGLRVGYFWGDFEPYLAGAYLYDNTWNDDSEDRDEIEGAIGLDFYPTDDFICSMAAAHTFFRDDTRNTRIMFNLRFEF